MVGRSGCSAGRPSFHRASATATPMVMSENNVIWSCRVDLVARSFQCASACRPKSSFYLLRAHNHHEWRAKLHVSLPVRAATALVPHASLEYTPSRDRCARRLFSSGRRLLGGAAIGLLSRRGEGGIQAA